MKHIRRSICLLMLCLLSAACDAGSPAHAQKSTAASVTAADNTPTSVTTTSLDGVIKKDMAYADARKALLAQGWTPERDKECKTNVGANEKLCKSSPNLDVCTICDDMPELSFYSDDGRAISYFRRAGQRLTVISSGVISDWKVSGESSRLAVADWHITAVAMPDKTSTR